MGLYGSEFITNIKKALTGLYDRDKRLKINGENFWVIEKDMFTKMEELSNEVLTNQISHSIIINIPHTIPFTLRAKIFQHCLEVTKQETGPYMHPISIRRSYIFEDSYGKIYQQKFNLKNKLHIKFINEQGMAEEGIDGGGLFKEFVTKLCDHIFDPEYAYFEENEKDRKLMPNANSKQFENYKGMFKFFGQIVGKSMYEGCLLKCTFTKTFLNRLVKKSN